MPILAYKRRKKDAHGERGSVLVENAFTIVLVFTFLFAILDFGRALYTYHFVANAAREGTRYAIVRGAGCSPSATGCPATLQDISNYVQSTAAGIGINTANLSVTPNWPPLNYDTGPAVTACNFSPAGFPERGCMVSVQVQYPFKAIFPFFPSTTCTIGNTQVQASICMSSTSQMVISQ